LTFALPLMLGNVFQQLYTMTTRRYVGHFVGVEALAALGAVECCTGFCPARCRALRRALCHY
jgi:Na+-driven multidrug efflux pump